MNPAPARLPHARLRNAWAQVTVAVRDRRGARLLHQVRADGLSYLSPSALRDLRLAVRAADRCRRPGVIVECGCALGGSSIVIAASREDATRPLYVYDVFGMIPPPGDNDGADVHARYHVISEGSAEGLRGDTYYGYREDLQAEVERTFTRFGMPTRDHQVHLVKGLFEDTLCPEWPVALAHLDGDWYESVTVCLERLWPALVPGGVVVVDDYFDWSGCRRAVDDFTATRADCTRLLRSRLHLVKRPT